MSGFVFVCIVLRLDLIKSYRIDNFVEFFRQNVFQILSKFFFFLYEFKNNSKHKLHRNIFFYSENSYLLSLILIFNYFIINKIKYILHYKV